MDYASKHYLCQLAENMILYANTNLPMRSPELSIVIPAYNEATHLQAVITEMVRVLDNSGIAYEVCIVNNGSTDNTSFVVSELEKKHATVTHVYLEKNQQYGGGIAAGLAAAHGEVLGWVHADGQANPEDIVRLYLAMRAEGCDLAKAIRAESHETTGRKLQSSIYNWLFRWMFWTRYRDINGTPRLLTRKAAGILKLKSRDWFLEPEFVIKSLQHKMPIVEIDTVWRTRRGGATKARPLTGLEFLKNMLLYYFLIK